MNIKEDLLLKLELLNKEISSDTKKYYHFRSVTNFIYHIDNLKDFAEQKFVTENLEYFFSSIKEEKISNIYDSLAAFNTFLKPIGELYEKKLGFFVMVKPWILTIWIVISFFFVYILNNRLCFILFFVSLSIFCFYLGNKYFNKKLYAFMW